MRHTILLIILILSSSLVKGQEDPLLGSMHRTSSWLERLLNNLDVTRVIEKKKFKDELYYLRSDLSQMVVTKMAWVLELQVLCQNNTATLSVKQGARLDSLVSELVKDLKTVQLRIQNINENAFLHENNLGYATGLDSMDNYWSLNSDQNLDEFIQELQFFPEKKIALMNDIMDLSGRVDPAMCEETLFMKSKKLLDTTRTIKRIIAELMERLG